MADRDSGARRALPGEGTGMSGVVELAEQLALAVKERDRYRTVLERIGRVHGPWRAVVAAALGCSVDDLDPRKRRPHERDSR